MNNKEPKISYEPEADILRIQVSNNKLYDTRESGNMVIHMDKNQEPIYVEILNASSFLQSSQKSVFDALAVKGRA